MHIMTCCVVVYWWEFLFLLSLFLMLNKVTDGICTKNESLLLSKCRRLC